MQGKCKGYTSEGQGLSEMSGKCKGNASQGQGLLASMEPSCKERAMETQETGMVGASSNQNCKDNVRETQAKDEFRSKHGTIVQGKCKGNTRECKGLS